MKPSILRRRTGRTFSTRSSVVDGNASLASPEARLVYQLPGPGRDSRSALIPIPLELLHRLSRLVPPSASTVTAITGCWRRAPGCGRG